MTREEIELGIRDSLATETSAIALSRRLFHPDGLFAKLATTEQERRALTRSALFVEALRRLSDLQHQEAATSARAIASVTQEGP
jgi:hypothetical protein